LAEEDPSDAEAFQIQGLALAKQGETEAATAMFREAARLAPTEAKHRYNLGAHLAEQGLREEARAEVAEAVRLAPSHADAAYLLDVLEGRTEPKPTFRHLLPWMRGRESLWELTGRALMGLGLVLAGLMITHIPAQPTGKAVPKGQMPDVALRADALSQLTVFLFVVSTLATFVWMLTDIVDRRKRFTWLVPLTICGVLGLNVLPMALYYFVGRKLGEDGVTKA
jgi:tetratricopeptide (TPR) repeat protein